MGAIPALVGALLLISGCSSDTPETQSASPLPSDPSTVVSIAFPEIGGFPEWDVLSDAEIERLRMLELDSLWGQVSAAHPGAARPDTPFERFIDGQAEHLEVHTPCFESLGVPVQHATDPDGNVVSVMAGFNTEAGALAEYSCRARFPQLPYGSPNAEQRAYIYDYLTQFVAPCYAANGIESPEPPSKDEFVANWPNQGWYPSTDAEMGSQRETELMEACTVEF